MNRRHFIATSAMAAVAANLPFPAMSAKIKRIGIQLYTLREELGRNLYGTLAELAKIGYKELESFPAWQRGHFWGLSPIEFQKKVQNLGMKVVSTHISTGYKEPVSDALSAAHLGQNFEKFADACAEAGLAYIVCPYLAEDERKNIDDYKRKAELFNRSGAICKERGITFCYHNHAFEFEKIDNQIPFDVLMEHTDPALVYFELDLFWITKAGFKAEEYINKYPGRYRLYHVKDMSATDKVFAPVGTGIIDFASIFKLNKVAGTQHFFVEQDKFTAPAMESVKTSFNNLKKLRF